MKVFVASNMETDYPWILQKPSTVNERVRSTAEEFIMDSGIGDEQTNQEVLDLAHEYQADWVVAKDYLHDQDATTESVTEFMQAYQSHECDATPLIPLQPPHSEHYEKLKGYTHYVLGGMAVDDVSTSQAIAYIRDAAKVMPDDAYIHALGVGGGIEFIKSIAGSGWIDSVDCSTPEMAAMFGRVLDAQLRQKPVRIASGEGVAKRNIALADFNSWQIHDAWEREEAQAESRNTLEAYQ